MRGIWTNFFIIAWYCLTPASAAPHLKGPVPAMVERVIDGDTLVVRARIWLDQDITVRVRIADIDTPELSRPRCPAERAKAEVAKQLAEKMIGPGAVTLSDIHYGKYAGRVVAHVKTGQGDLAETLKAQGLDGDEWC